MLVFVNVARCYTWWWWWWWRWWRWWKTHEFVDKKEEMLKIVLTIRIWPSSFQSSHNH